MIYCHGKQCPRHATCARYTGLDGARGDYKAAGRLCESSAYERFIPETSPPYTPRSGWVDAAEIVVCRYRVIFYPRKGGGPHTLSVHRFRWLAWIARLRAELRNPLGGWYYVSP